MSQKTLEFLSHSQLLEVENAEAHSSTWISEDPLEKETLLQSCRCCLEIQDVSNQFPFSSSYENGTIMDLIQSITNIKIDEDPDLPGSLCSVCLEKFLTAEQVVLQFMESDKVLKSLVEQAKTLKKEVKEESELLISEIYSQHIPDSIEDSVVEFVTSSQIETPSGRKRKLKEIPLNIKIEKSEEPETTMECDTCLKSFKTQFALRKHCQNHRTNRDPAPFSCQTCEKPFYCSTIFAKHVCILKPVCYYCNVLYGGKKSLLEHMDKEHRNPFDSNLTCNLEGCNYSCQRSFTMLHHLMSHYDPIETVCPYCAKYFNDWLKYRQHVSAAHRNKREMICDACGSKFHSRGNIIRHFLSMHLNRRVYCDECPNSYSTRENLKLHKMNAHGLESKFACSSCPAKFVYESYLRAHEEKHLAGKTVRRRRIGQPKVSESFPCQFCGRNFSLEVNMKRHVRTVHQKIRDFICPYEGCNAAFAMNSTLQIHARIHTGLKPYVCPICPSACYSDPSTLSKHMKNIHKIKYSRPRQKKSAKN